MNQPLAYRVRPAQLSEIVGQEELIGENSFLFNSVKNKEPISFILFGAPGCGKTTIAIAYAKSIGINYKKINAVTSNKKDIENAIEEAKTSDGYILIIDEIHRLNKDKQDILLPYTEDGTIYLIGCTTANPYISINKAIRSRCHLLEVKKLTHEDLIKGMKSVINRDYELKDHFFIDEDALNYVAKASNGDFRFALNYLEILYISYKSTKITLNKVKEVIKVPNLSIDKDEDWHYDAVSAMQKSIRGSDVNAALYYAARLLLSGDLDSLCRRLLVTAYEDIGLGNPQACMRTKIAIDSAKEVGLPEAIYPLSLTIVDLCLSPKSTAACDAYERASETASSTPLDVLDYLKYTPVNVDDDHKYPYDNKEVWAHLQYLPELIKEARFYEINNNSSSSYEKLLNENYKKIMNNFKTSDIALLNKKYKNK